MCDFSVLWYAKLLQKVLLQLVDFINQATIVLAG